MPWGARVRPSRSRDQSFSYVGLLASPPILAPLYQREVTAEAKSSKLKYAARGWTPARYAVANQGMRLAYPASATLGSEKCLSMKPEFASRPATAAMAAWPSGARSSSPAAGLLAEMVVTAEISSCRPHFPTTDRKS